MTWSIERIGHALSRAELRRYPRLEFTIVRRGNDLRGAVFARVAPTAALVAEIDHTLYEFEVLAGSGQTVLTVAGILREFEALEGTGQLVLMGAGASSENEAAQGNGYIITNGAGDIMEAEQLESVGQMVNIGPGLLVESDALAGVGRILVNGAGEVQEHEAAEGDGEVVEGSGGEINPYYDPSAAFYYELSNALDANNDAHLSLVNSPSFAADGVFGKCLTFNGTQYAYDDTDLIAAAIAANAHSVRLRAYVTFAASGNVCIASFSGTAFAVFIRSNNRFEIRWGGTSSKVDVASLFWSGITLGQRYELVVEWGYWVDSGVRKGCRAYLDGNLLGDNPTATYSGASVTEFQLGQWGPINGWYLNGSVDELAIYTPVP